MYDELIKNLRICSRCDFGQDCNGCTQDRDDRFCCDILLHNAADAIEKLVEERDMYIKAMADEHNRAARLAWEHRWIPVTERLPELGEVVLLTDGKDTGDGYLAMYDFSTECPLWSTPFVDLETENITHWMPLPQPPKEE